MSGEAENSDNYNFRVKHLIFTSFSAKKMYVVDLPDSDQTYVLFVKH